MKKNIVEVMRQFKLFWQYPVITEQTFYNQALSIKNYLPFPWATIIDRQYDQKIVFNIIINIMIVNKNLKKFTCCQHINFRKLIPLFKALNITVLYTPHKVINQDEIDGIKIKPCPLYAVNFEDPDRNEIFKGKDFTTVERKYLYSFQGAWDPAYLTNIRLQIFNIKSLNNIFIKNIGTWHFNEMVYSANQNKDKQVVCSDKFKQDKKDYNKLLLDSRYSLCPSGSGPNSIRLWESLAVGAIPIVLADTLELPKHALWEKAVLRIKEKDLYKLDEILSKISKEEEILRRENCLKIYNHFRTNFMNTDVYN